jgi:tetratricopeptide (TPR) repeat protein
LKDRFAAVCRTLTHEAKPRMTPNEHPDTPPSPTGIQKPSSVTASPEAPAISLAPLPQPAAMDPGKWLGLCRGLDAALVAVVLLFAFLLACFPVTNPDFFRSLASGRLIAQGNYPFGVDPFVYTSEGYFVNHSWLFDLLMYVLYQLPSIGGMAVVVFKAAAIVVLAEVMLRTGRRIGQSLWIPAVFTALALLVLSPRLYLKSACISYLFLGLTLWLLTAERPGGKRWWWLLPPLFALWVNCDAWFVLGPLAVGLYLAGEVIQRMLAGEAEEANDGTDAANATQTRKLGLVLLVGVAACLLSPHHYHALKLPIEFGLVPAGDAIEADPQFRTLFLSPLRKEYYAINLGWSAAGLAYWPLLLAGLISFALVFGRAPWQRLLVWMGFALLSLYNMRAIPFFAVVAGPITALNWLDYATHSFGDRPHRSIAWRNWSLGGRALTLLFGLLLLFAAVPGWLQAQPHEFHQVGWGVRVDPSLEDMAKMIRTWREQGKLEDDPHWFNTHYEIAYYLAWYAPGERVFLDQEIPYFPEAANDYLSLRQPFEELAGSQDGSSKSLDKIYDVLRKHGVRYWIFDNRIRRKSDLVARALLVTNSKDWALVDWKGRMAVFAWRDPKSSQGDAKNPKLKPIDLQVAAFGPNAEPAPERGPDPTPRPHPWHEVLWHPLPRQSADREKLLLDSFLFQTIEEQTRMKQIEKSSRAWQAAVAAGALAPSLPGLPLPPNVLPLDWSWTYHELFPPGALRAAREFRKGEEGAMEVWRLYTMSQPLEPPATLYMAVRAARRAVLVNPEDSQSYFHLAVTYKRLREQRLESVLPKAAPILTEIRRVQTTTALQKALALEPDTDTEAEANLMLFEEFAQLQYLDAAARHLRQAMNARTKLGPPPNVSPTQFEQYLENMSKELTRRETELESRQNRYVVNAATKTGMEKVKIALDLNLTDTAFEALNQVAQEGIKEFTPVEKMIVRQATLVALNLGRLERAQELLPELPDQESLPPTIEDLDLYLRLAVARGDYEKADKLLEKALTHIWPAPRELSNQLNPSLAVAESISRVCLNGAMTWSNLDPWPFMKRRWRLDAVNHGLDAAHRNALWSLIRGWLALEAGHNKAARQQFEKVREIIVPDQNWIPEVNDLNAWLIPQVEIPEMQKKRIIQAHLYDLSTRYMDWLK